MQLTRIFLTNYRNFANEEINLLNHSLIIGANDVGKSNLLRAVRLILDKNLSQAQYDIDDSDYCIFSKDDFINITLEFKITDEIDDEYVISKLGTYIKDDFFYVTYYASKSSGNTAHFYIGHNSTIEDMKEVPRSTITSVISCVYLDSTRDLQSYLRRAKQRLINGYKINRSEEEIADDDDLIGDINSQINKINSDVEKVSFIGKPTELITSEIQAMSLHSRNENIKLTAFSEFDDLIKNTGLITDLDGSSVEISGDGKRNQIFMSMWLRENQSAVDNKKTFIIFLVEEPEAHLHFPMQSTTLKYILKNYKNQMLFTTHSPKVVLQFYPEEIVRLFTDQQGSTVVSNRGCSKELKDRFFEFGYRNNLISGEMFFSDAVFLVEGPSEVILYEEMCNQLGIDLNFLNIRIIPVYGIGFESYANLLKALSIQFTIKTDNDIKISKNDMVSLIGINRLIRISNKFYNTNIAEITSFKKDECQSNLQQVFDDTMKELNKKGLFISHKDLENDFCKILDENDFFENNLKFDDEKEMIKYLQSQKATNMYKLISDGIDLKILDKSDFSLPISFLLKILQPVEVE